MKTFTIRIELGTGRKYAISLLEGVPGTIGALPIAKEERGGFNASAMRKQVLERSDDTDAIGQKLGKFLLAGAVGSEWTARADTGEAMRTYLDVCPPDLERAPWEFARVNAGLFLQMAHPFTTFRAGPTAKREPEWGLRVLIVLAAKDANDEIGSWQEEYAIRQTVRRVSRVIDVATLRWPSRKTLQGLIGDYQPHVLHLIGHGDNHGPQLYDGKDLVPWGPAEVEVDVQGWSSIPELVYLNTCRSSGGSAGPLKPSGQDQQWTVVERFLKAGVSAVIAMHADVKGVFAGLCAAEFYTQLAKGAGIDVAITAGRLRIAQEAPGNERSIEPYLPQLIVTQPVERILQFRALSAIEECKELKPALETFVDRDVERRKLVALLEAGKPAVLIKGPPDVGKTWLLQWSMDACLRREISVRYVQISACRTWLDVVRLIRDGNPKMGNVSSSLGSEPRALLNWRLNALARGIADPAPDEFTGTEVETREDTKILTDPGRAMVDAHIKAMEALQAALEGEAGERALVVVLDNFAAGDHGLSEAHFLVLLNHWIEERVIPGTSNIRVIVGLNTEQIKTYRLETAPAGFEPIDLGYFPSDKFPELMLELLPARYSLIPEDQKFLKWLRREVLRTYLPETLLNGPALHEECEKMWNSRKFLKQLWEKEP
jgi:hypothetical protein